MNAIKANVIQPSLTSLNLQIDPLNIELGVGVPDDKISADKAYSTDSLVL